MPGFGPQNICFPSNLSWISQPASSDHDGSSLPSWPSWKTGHWASQNQDCHESSEHCLFKSYLGHELKVWTCQYMRDIAVGPYMEWVVNLALSESTLTCLECDFKWSKGGEWISMSRFIITGMFTCLGKKGSTKRMQNIVLVTYIFE